MGSDTISDAELSWQVSEKGLGETPAHTGIGGAKSQQLSHATLAAEKNQPDICLCIPCLWRVTSRLSQEGNETWDKSSQSVIHRCVV